VGVNLRSLGGAVVLSRISRGFGSLGHEVSALVELG
jgi:hypothetical protein